MENLVPRPLRLANSRVEDNFDEIPIMCVDERAGQQAAEHSVEMTMIVQRSYKHDLARPRSSTTARRYDT